MADALRQVQAPTPLHASYLWPLQQAWHASHAEQASRVWTESATPIFATSNAYIASAYARVILGLLRDWFAAPPPPPPAAGSSGSAAAPPRDEPVRILEAGAGHGRLAYLVLRELWSLEEHWPAVPSGGKFGGVVGAGGRPVPFRVVITDVMGGCVDFWRAHESLQPFLAAGVLDLGVLDATGEGGGSGGSGGGGACVLQPSGLRLAPGALRAPLVVLANYLFSSLRQDLVALEGGVAQQARVAIFSPQASDADASQPPAGQAQAQPDPTLISRMRLVWSYAPREECVAARAEGEPLHACRVGSAPFSHTAAALPTLPPPSSPPPPLLFLAAPPTPFSTLPPTPLCPRCLRTMLQRCPRAPCRCPWGAWRPWRTSLPSPLRTRCCWWGTRATTTPRRWRARASRTWACTAASPSWQTCTLRACTRCTGAGTPCTRPFWRG